MSDSKLTAADITRRYERAHDEVMRVVGMGKHAQSVRGGPHGEVRHSIPANEDRDTDLLICASLDDIPALVSEVERLRAVERAAREYRAFMRETARVYHAIEGVDHVNMRMEQKRARTRALHALDAALAALGKEENRDEA